MGKIKQKHLLSVKVGNLGCSQKYRKVLSHMKSLKCKRTTGDALTGQWTTNRKFGSFKKTFQDFKSKISKPSEICGSNQT